MEERGELEVAVVEEEVLAVVAGSRHLQFVLGEAVVGGAALAHEARRVAEGGGAVVTRLHEVHGAVGSPPQ